MALRAAIARPNARPRWLRLGRGKQRYRAVPGGGAKELRVKDRTIGSMQGMADWFWAYAQGIKKLLANETSDDPPSRWSRPSREVFVSNLADDMARLKDALPRRVRLEREPVAPAPRTLTGPPSVRSVPVAVVHVGRRPARIPEAVEADYCDDYIPPLPPPPSKTVKMRFQWVGPRTTGPRQPITE